jgi:hypothetical protein
VRSQEIRPGRPLAASLPLVIAVIAGVLAVAGCAQMDKALGQQYLVVQFAPNTTLATARHVTAACSRVPNVRLQPVKPTTAQVNVAYSATYNTTDASAANLARLQVCLARFRSVLGVTATEPGD